MVNYQNIVVHIVGASHLTFAAVSLFFNAIPHHILPIDQAFSGKFKYLTFWNAAIESVYFCVSLVDDLLSRRNGKDDDDTSSCLRKILDRAFISVVLPLSAFVSITFWGIWAVDRELVMPKSVDPFFASWLNHSVHTCVIIYSLLELATRYHKEVKTSKNVIDLSVLNLIYVAWIHVVYYKSGYWVYPILAELNTPLRIVFFAGSFGLNIGLLFIGRYLNKRIWKKSIQKKAMQITDA